MRCGLAATAAANGAPDESMAMRPPRSRTRVTRAAYRSVGAPGGRLPQPTTQSARSAPSARSRVVASSASTSADDRVGAGLVELRRRAVGLEDADVHPDRAAHRHGRVGDPGGVEQVLEQVALGSAARQHRDGRVALGCEGAGDVDALAARVDAAAASPGAPRRDGARR